MNLSVVIPAYNEVDSICGLVDEVCQTLDDVLKYEIIVVDDGSTDDTPAVLQQCRAEQPNLRVLRHTRCCGQSAAIGSGVRAACADWIITLDGDGQNDPADIMRLYRAMDESTDRTMLIAGQRANRRDDNLKRFSSRIATVVRAWILQDSTPDTGCGIKLFSKKTYARLPQFDHMHRFLPVLVQRQGGEVVSIVVNHRARKSGVSKYGIMNRLWVGIVDVLGVKWLQRRHTLPVISEIE